MAHTYGADPAAAAGAAEGAWALPRPCLPWLEVRGGRAVGVTAQHPGPGSEHQLGGERDVLAGWWTPKFGE